MSDINVFGAGAFGTALAVVLARKGQKVTLVARRPDHVSEMTRSGENTLRLPGARLPDNLVPSLDPSEAGEICLMVVPTQTLSAYARDYSTFLSDRIAVACCKGVDLKTGTGPTSVLEAAAPGVRSAILSGPGFASDIAKGLPTALTIASSETSLTSMLQRELSSETLRLYRSEDVTGVELGGALKNVIALAAGVSIGAGLGESARAAVVTRGYAEMIRFAVAQGARAETLSGLSGFGDLLLSATSETSRNYAYGIDLGRGNADTGGKTVEGVSTAKAVSNLGKLQDIDMPITHTVSSLTRQETTVENAVMSLMSRPLREE